MPIQHDRIKRDVSAIATCTETPGAGATRPTFSESWRAACDYVVDQLESHGCEIRIDAAGNIHGRPRELGWDAPAWLSGSHLDSVPNGGDFDGVAGVVVPLELLRAAHDDGRADLPLELVVFAEEEGTTFGMGMIGSHAFVGDVSAEDLAGVRNKNGENYIDAGTPHGVRGQVIGRPLFRPETVRGFVEVHVAQGPRLWAEGKRVAVVNAVAGRRQYRCRVIGRANHAGSTAMADRQDALAAAAEIIVKLEELAVELPFRSVITVGRLFSRPNAINVITGQVDMWIDFRSPDNDILHDGDRRIQALAADVRLRRGIKYRLECTESLPAERFDEGLCESLCAAAHRIGFTDVPLTISGALHDAAILSRHLPSAMLFIASREGISHNPDEFSRTEDVTEAAQILWEMIDHAVSDDASASEKQDAMWET